MDKKVRCDTLMFLSGMLGASEETSSENQNLKKLKKAFDSLKDTFN